MPLTRVLLGLGSNVQRELHLSAGLDALQQSLADMHCSPVFESLAVGYKGDNFYNLVVSGWTELPLAELERRLKAIEVDNGRYAPDRKGLPLDIDVLMYGDLVGNFHGIELPRPETLKNAFVLWPLALLAPEVVHPQARESFAKLWNESKIDQRLWPVPFCWNGVQLTPASLLKTESGH